MRKFSADVRVPTGVEVTVDRLRGVLEGLDGAERSTVPDERSISVRTRVSLWSWGERVTCTIASAHGGFVVRVESKSLIPTTLIDYGVNRRNVERVVRVLENLKQ